MMSGDPSAPVPADDLAMNANPYVENAAPYAAPFVALARDDSALQHNALHLGPRPLPLFLSLVRNHHLTAPAEAQRALEGLRKLQTSIPIAAPAAMPVKARTRQATLLDYGGSGPNVVFVPSLINPPTVLDITAERSLVRWLSTQEFHPYLVDWGSVSAAEASISISDYVADILIPTLRALEAPVHLVGYCLGGTMALAAAHLHPVRSVSMIAAPWRFGHYPAPARAAMAKLWADAEPSARQMGCLPMEMLQLMFWQLDPAGTVQKYARFAGLDDESTDAALFIAMEQWANGGAPLSYAAARELFEDFIANDMPGHDGWRINDTVIRAETAPCPMIEFVSLADRIVPAATATGRSNRQNINRGHVGMITGSQAKVQLWEPLRQWLSQPQHC